MTQTECMERAENAFIHTYGRFKSVFDKGEGVYLYDTDGKKYLDFYSGIGVNALGYGDEYLEKVMHEQLDKLLHVSNYFYTEPVMMAAEAFNKASGMDGVFFTNSGAEAVEGAVKLARKYFYKTRGRNGGNIIAMNKSFHGRTMGAVAVTGTKKYREPFEPLIGGVSFADFNDIDSVKALIDDNTAAIILETIQGEGGVNVVDAEFLKAIRNICDEKDIVLILDEIQCGMGRSGCMFAYQKFGVQPDIVTSAKALGCGVPVGAFAAVKKVADAFEPGDHGSTYGGNPFVTATVTAVFERFEQLDLLKHVDEMAGYLYGKLEEIKDKYPSLVVEHRGLGLMQGLEFNTEVKSLVAGALEEGMVLISAGANTLRFLPPLIITKEQIDEMAEKLVKVIDKKCR